jgi:hypothetical protein
MPNEIPTTERLAKALEEVHAPEDMIKKAREGYYDDYKSPLPMPETQLYHDAKAYGLESIARGVINGEWDATKEESDAWAKSAEGQEVMQNIFGNRAQRRRKN